MRNNSARLAELQRLMILDSAPESDYDAIAEALAASLGVPITMVNLLDGKRDWFKSCVGLEMRESPAETSFCQAFLQTTGDAIIAPDTTLDPRFAENPLVVGPPFIRFYAAQRLTVRGHTVGTLCAYDLQPRTISKEQVANLQALAGAVGDLLARRSKATPVAPAATAPQGASRAHAVT